jgi:DNA-binding MurR/RpiR family transcriptional regulator
MSPAETRVARYFQDHPEEVLIASAASLAERAKTSDATVVRAARALGFSGLDELRRTIAQELRNTPTPAERLTRTLEAVGGKATDAFVKTLDLHSQSLDTLRRSVPPRQYEKAVEGIIQARRVVVFGLGPSSAIANYLVIQLGRFGLEALAVTSTGLLFADDLRKLRRGDLVIMFAYGRMYSELEALLGEISRLRLRSFLITDSLAASVGDKVDLILSVPRGRSDMLSMHTATLAFVEALLVGVATKRPAKTLASLNALNDARMRLVGKRMALVVAAQDRR